MDKVFVVKHLRASAFVHATEVQGRVKEALLSITPPNVRSSLTINEEVVKGHHGNEIRIYEIELHGNTALETLRHLICSLSESDRTLLLMSLNDRVGDVGSHLYLRLGKQEAYIGLITIRDGSDVIKVSVTVDRCRTTEDLRKFLTELIKGC